MNNLINKVTFRSKNSILFMILVGFLLSLILILFNFDFSINEYLKNVKEKNIDWRSVLVDTEDLNNIEKFKSIDHVTQVTDINFFIYGFFIDKSQNITLYALNENELNNLEIVNGNKNVQGNNLICPKKFKTVGSTFSRNFKRIRYTASREKEILDERDETFYISANYDSKKIMLDGVTCFTSLENLERIARYTDYNEDVNYSLSTINIIVDNIKNIDYVKEELKKMGFDSYDKVEIDYNGLKNLEIIFIVVLCFMLIMVYIAISLHLKRNIESKKKEILLYKSIGFANKNIFRIYGYEYLIVFVFSILFAYLINLLETFAISNILIRTEYFELLNYKMNIYSMLIIIPIGFILIVLFSLNKIRKVVKGAIYDN